MSEPINPYQPPDPATDQPHADLPGPALALDAEEVYTPGGGRAVAAMVFLGLALVADLLSIAGGLWRHSALGGGGSGSVQTLQLATALYGFAAIMQLAAFVGGAITFIMWFHRAYRNVRAMGVPLQFGLGWSIGGWFVPFLNLVRPYQIAREIWVDSDSLQHPSSSGAGLVGLWWALWLGSNILSNVGALTLGREVGVGVTSSGTVVTVVAEVLSVGAAVAAMAMIRAIEARQRARHEERQRAASRG